MYTYIYIYIYICVCGTHFECPLVPSAVHFAFGAQKLSPRSNYYTADLYQVAVISSSTSTPRHVPIDEVELVEVELLICLPSTDFTDFTSIECRR